MENDADSTRERIGTAEEIRRRIVTVTLPGTRLQIKCRRPDPLQLISSGLLNLPTFGAVLEVITEALSAGRDALDNRQAAQAASTEPGTYVEFLDRWVVGAAIDPVVVLTESESIDDPTKLWVRDIDIDARAEIFRRTSGSLVSPRLNALVKSFRTRQSESAPAGPDGEAIRDTPVAAAAHP